MNNTESTTAVNRLPKPLYGMPVNLEADPKDFPPPKFTVEKLLVEEQINLLLGPWGWGKSMLALQAMLGMASGTTWLGESCQKRKALYVCPEMTTGQLLARCNRLAPGLNGDGKNAAIIGSDRIGSLNMGYSGHVKVIIDLMRQGRCDVLILDTFRQCSRGNENDSDKAATFAEGCRDVIRAQAQGGILVLHHPKKADDELPNKKLLRKGLSARGSGELMGMMENVVCGVEVEDEKHLVWTKWRGNSARPNSVLLNQGSNGEFSVPGQDGFMKDW